MSAAPQPLNDLVGKIRSAHPGAYDDLDDAALTKRALAKYPQYSDLAAPKLQPPHVDVKSPEGPIAQGLTTMETKFADTPSGILRAMRDPEQQKLGGGKRYYGDYSSKQPSFGDVAKKLNPIDTQEGNLAMNLGGTAANLLPLAVDMEGGGIAESPIGKLTTSIAKPATAARLGQSARVVAKAAGTTAENLPVIGAGVKGVKALGELRDIWKPEEVPPATYPGAPLPTKPLGVELNAAQTPHAISAAQSGEALSTVKTPQRLIARPEAFRSRSIGEQGIPYNAKTPAEASMSEDEVRDRLMPGREEYMGKPQELIGVDLSKTPGFSTKAGPNSADWVKFHGDVPESAVRRISSAKPSAIDTSKLGNLLNEGTGGKLPTVSGKLESSVPLKEQLSNSPAKSSLPQGFTPVKSSALQGYKYDPATQHFEVITTGGARHGIQGISPEDFDTFQNSDSLGKAWNQLKKSPGVIKTKNGTPRAIPLEYRSASPDDLTPELEESLKQAKAGKGKSE